MTKGGEEQTAWVQTLEAQTLALQLSAQVPVTLCLGLVSRESWAPHIPHVSEQWEGSSGRGAEHWAVSPLWRLGLSPLALSPALGPARARRLLRPLHPVLPVL